MVSTDLCRGRVLKIFQCWQEGGTGNFSIFSGGVSKKGGVDFFRGGAEDLLNVIFKSTHQF